MHCTYTLRSGEEWRKTLMHEQFIKWLEVKILLIFHLFLLSLQTLTVLNPFRVTEKEVVDDCDLAGPLVFCLAFGSFLLLVSFLVVVINFRLALREKTFFSLEYSESSVCGKSVKNTEIVGDSSCWSIWNWSSLKNTYNNDFVVAHKYNDTAHILLILHSTGLRWLMLQPLSSGSLSSFVFCVRAHDKFLIVSIL